ncbi:MAG TPA: CYTH domain-containing protein [Candidatus Saccharimonadales bacterium]
MQTEIEAKFLDVNHDTMRAKLTKLGAKCVHQKRLMKRKNYDYANGRLENIGGWVRLRNEGDKVTLSYKQLNDRTLHGTKEVSLVVGDFDAANDFLVAIGLGQNSLQETMRESWELDGVQIELDEWPWIKPFLEIEGPSEAAVKDIAAKLGLDWQEATHGSVEVAYQTEYDVTEAEVDSWPEIIFGETPTWLEAKRKRA